MSYLEVTRFRYWVTIIVLPTLLNNEVSNDQHHGVPGEDVVPAELLLVPQGYPPIPSNPGQLGPDI